MLSNAFWDILDDVRLFSETFNISSILDRFPPVVMLQIYWQLSCQFHGWNQKRFFFDLSIVDHIFGYILFSCTSRLQSWLRLVSLKRFNSCTFERVFDPVQLYWTIFIGFSVITRAISNSFPCDRLQKIRFFYASRLRSLLGSVLLKMYV